MFGLGSLCLTPYPSFRDARATKEIYEQTIQMISTKQRVI